jgi:hypothetical protein
MEVPQIHQSRYPPVPLPSDISLADFVLNSAAFGSAPDRAILADPQGRTLTPLQLRRAVRAVPILFFSIFILFTIVKSN